LDEHFFGLSRDQLMKILHAENVLARRYFFPGCHNMQPYKSLFPHARLLLPQTESLNKRVLALPTGTAVRQEDIMTIAEIIRFAQMHAKQLSVQLAAS
jgi:dTDP-4-amino-4,6-dideoxygalactose transaminase